jgi:hypothetical protein
MERPAAPTWEPCRRRDNGLNLPCPASLVNLTGSTLNGLAFTLYGGRATWDCAGASNSMTSSTNPVIPTIAFGATTPASRVGLTPGTVTLSRSGDTSSALSVGYSLGGSAVAGVDYQVSQSPNINFAAGSSSATMMLTPVTSTNIAASQNVVVTLAAGTGYSVGAPGMQTRFQ